ncbi:MAG: hypothetical protein OEU36_26085 [Gammaproteobacteria bacterium]|nr:hypothetical protein [Gammaproteobacteria bacterium]
MWVAKDFGDRHDAFGLERLVAFHNRYGTIRYFSSSRDEKDKIEAALVNLGLRSIAKDCVQVTIPASSPR